MEYFVISAKFVPLKYYTLSSQLRHLTSFSVGLIGSANSVTRSYPVMRKSCIHFWNPYDKTNLTLFSEKSEHVPIFDPCGTLKVNGGHLGNATICGISEKKKLFMLVQTIFALRRSCRVTEFADPNTQLKTRLDAAVAMKVYSISAGRTLH